MARGKRPRRTAASAPSAARRRQGGPQVAELGGLFHEPQALGAIERHVAAALCRADRAAGPLRVWVPGCAAGSDAYAIAMLFHQRLADADGGFPLRVFATDLDAAALALGRWGDYRRSTRAPAKVFARFKPFFSRSGTSGCRVAEAVRSSVIFARHDLLCDAPLSKLDLIYCRDALAGFNDEVRAKLLELFHFLLNRRGFLVLGRHDPLVSAGGLFEPVSRKWPIYARRPSHGAARLPFPLLSRRLHGSLALRPVPGGQDQAAAPQGRPAPAGDDAWLAAELARSLEINDDLAAANEELDTAHEEMRLLNEELLFVNQRLQDQVAAIERARDDIQRLQREALDAADREQRRIGQDLHDDLGQALTGLGLLAHNLLESLDPGAANAGLARRIAVGIQAAVGRLRDVVHGLVPVVVGPDGLTGALAQLANQVSRLPNVSCTFECPRPVDAADSFVGAQLYRIAQESVANAIKHGRAGQVAIALGGDDGSLTLSVEDDGCGIEPGRSTGGMGLQLMAHRAEVLGGTLGVRAGVECGTIVECTVPLGRSGFPA